MTSKNIPVPPPPPTGLCFCDCGEPTKPGSYFNQGHDKRVEQLLNRIEKAGSIVERLVLAGYGPGGKSLRAVGVERGVAEECGLIKADGSVCTVYSSPGSAGLRRHRQVAHPEQTPGSV
jgi:hypothetical protein